MGEYFANISQTVKDIAFPMMAEIAHDCKAGAIYCSNECYGVRIVGNSEQLIDDMKHLIILRVPEKRSLHSTTTI